MKLWIDAQLSPALAKWIAENFASIEAIAVRDLGLRDAEDQIIFFSARNADATVMTKARLIEIVSVNLQKAVELLEGGEVLVEITG